MDKFENFIMNMNSNNSNTTNDTDTNNVDEDADTSTNNADTNNNSFFDYSNLIMEHQMNIQNLYNMVNIYKDADKLIPYLSRCNFFYSPLLLKWVKDYYKVQMHLTDLKLKFNRELDIPSACNLFVWTNKDIQCQIKYDFLGNHVGVLNLNPIFTYVFYRLKIFKEVNPELYDVILPTKLDIEFDDINKLIYLTVPDNVENFSAKKMKNATLRNCNVNNIIQGTKDYIDTCKYYYGFDDLITEVNYIAESIYGYITLLLRAGVDFESLGDIDLTKEIRIGDVAIYEGIEAIIDMENYDTGFANINSYGPDVYNYHSDEKRSIPFKQYGDNTFNMFDIDKPNSLSQEYISSYQDIKQLIAYIFFGTDTELLKKFNDKYIDEEGLFIQFDSVGAVLQACKDFKDNKVFIYDPNKNYYINDVVIRDIFYNAFNDKHNLLVNANMSKLKIDNELKNEFIDYTEIGKCKNNTESDDTQKSDVIYEYESDKNDSDNN